MTDFSYGRNYGTTLAPSSGVTPDTTGVVSGGTITINADPTKFDVAAGTGVIIDWTNPLTPVRSTVTWSESLGNSLPSLVAGITTISIDISGALQTEIVATSDPTPEQYRERIYLQSAFHLSGVQIDSLGTNRAQAFEVVASLLDYIRRLGAVNKGNKISANGNNLKLDRAAGDVFLPFISTLINTQNPGNISTDSEAAINFSYVHRDAAGNPVVTPLETDIDPTVWDDGSGVLASVPNGKYTYQIVYIFAQTNTPSIAVIRGQECFSSLDDASAAAQYADVEAPRVLDGGIQRAAIVTRQSATDLLGSNAKIINYRN